MFKSKDNSKKQKQSKKPLSAFAVLFIIIAMMAGLTWIIPSGQYQEIQNPETHEIETAYVEQPKVQLIVDEETGEQSEVDTRQGFWDFFNAPMKGMSDKLDVIIFVLILGGFLNLVMKTGAFDASLGGLLKKMKGREKWLIPILMTLFAIGGTTYGMQEEAVAFYALVVPVLLAAGYNGMTAVMVIVLGAGSGVLASTVNPFSTGIAASGADIPLSNILLPQAIILILSLTASIIFTMRYASKVKAGDYKEDSTKKPAVKALELEKVPEFTLERKFVMGVFAFTFIIMIISLIPWGDFGVTIFKDIHEWLVGLPVVGAVFGFSHALPFGEWYFAEISALFMISSAAIYVINYENFAEEGISGVDIFLAGVADLLNVALVIAVAAGIGEVMRAGAIQDTIVFWGSELLKNVPSGLVGILAYIFYIPMSFIIPSSSGLATATVPILAPVADIVGSSREVVVVAFATASGLLNMIAPTIASLLAGLALAGVPYKQWVKRTLPLMTVLAIISFAVILAMEIL